VNWNRAEPENPWPYLVRGYLLAEEEAWVLADEAFEKGLARMTPEERKPFGNLAIVDPEEEEKKFLSPDTTRFVQDYWRWKDPSPADELNPALLEFYRRMVQAELLFGLEQFDLRGWDHAPGRMLVRYGTPRRWGYRQFVFEDKERRVRPTSSFSAPALIVAYGRGVEPIFFQFIDFNLQGRYIHPVTAFPRDEDYWIAAQPSLFLSPFPGKELEQTVELWRFVNRRGEGTIEVAVALDPDIWPEPLLAQPYRLASRVVTYDPRWDVADATLGSWANFETDDLGRLVGVFRLAGTADSTIVGWETADRSEDARSAGYTTLSPLDVDVPLLLSDLAFLSRISFAPGQGSYARAYGGGLPNPGHLYRVGDDIGIHFRAYGLEAGEAGMRKARLTVTVGRRTRSGFLNVLLGRGQDPPAASLVFQAEDPGPALEQLLALDVPRLDPGEYELTVEVEDLTSGRTTHRTAPFRVVASDSGSR
jgi:GWxTD domain-containing protein